MSRLIGSTARLLTSFVLLITFSLPLAYAQEAPFTIQADADLQAALTALYAARYDGAAPAFVEANADVLASADADALAAAYDGLPAYYLPEVGLVPLTENAQALAFIDFAVSPDGQEVLIGEGLLPESVTLTDSTGAEVEVPQPVRAVVSAYGPTTYYFYALGAGDRIVMASFLGANGPAADTMRRIDPDFDTITSYEATQRAINIEAVATLDPDLIVSSARASWADQVREMQFPLFLVEIETPEQVQDAMLLYGQMLGPNALARAEAWIAYYDEIYARVTEQTETIAEEDRPNVLFHGSDLLRVASGDMYQSDMIEAAGGVSASGELTGFWNDVNLEQIVTWDPDMIFLPGYGDVTRETLLESQEYQALRAVQDGAVYDLPKLVAPWDTPGPDSALGLLWMAHTLHPDLIAFDCAAETQSFYRTFYDYELLPEEVARLCGS